MSANGTDASSLFQKGCRRRDLICGRINHCMLLHRFLCLAASSYRTESRDKKYGIFALADLAGVDDGDFNDFR